MKLKVSLRSCEARTWKSQKSGSEGHQVEGLALEIGGDATIIPTIAYTQKFPTRAEADKAAAAFAGKECILNVKELGTTFQGDPVLVGVLELAK